MDPWAFLEAFKKGLPLSISQNAELKLQASLYNYSQHCVLWSDVTKFTFWSYTLSACLATKRNYIQGKTPDILQQNMGVDQWCFGTVLWLVIQGLLWSTRIFQPKIFARGFSLGHKLSFQQHDEPNILQTRSLNSLLKTWIGKTTSEYIVRDLKMFSALTLIPLQAALIGLYRK